MSKRGRLLSGAFGVGSGLSAFRRRCKRKRSSKRHSLLPNSVFDPNPGFAEQLFRQLLIVNAAGNHHGANHGGPTDNGEATALGMVATKATTEPIDLGARAIAHNLAGEITTLLEAGTIRPVIDQLFPFHAVNEALTYIETGRVKGKVVVQLI